MESKLLGREFLPILTALAASTLLLDAIPRLLGAAWVGPMKNCQTDAQFILIWRNAVAFSEV